ncbi:hypothetical protein JMN32_14980 [Fulvivirga sp. 29W222]|uniref:Cyclic nucleotide-binding domain-containing protein n=1 Tax=Fulvivirga marina TaxID=2494733 RepID=A0A937KEW4_9BACT|nr:hypothetical protein [Fulvivirga marina]MBL6447620.1 hypothetical protein [Fulvivirga marina]
MRLKVLTLMVLLFSIHEAKAQVQNDKGTITLKNGEQITGMIRYSYDEADKVIIDAEKGKLIYSPGEVENIVLENGRRLVSKIHDKASRQALILQSIIESTGISLYSEEKSDVLRYYVEKEDQIYLLTNNKVKVVRDNVPYHRDDKKYIGQLTILMSDRPELASKLKDIDLKEADLIRVIQAYNRGNISYFMESDNTLSRQPNWLYFMQYSHYGTFLLDDVVGGGGTAGFQFYFAKEKRSSLKFGFNHSLYKYNDEEKANVSSMNLYYQLDAVRKEKFTLYFLMHLMDVAYVKTSGDPRFINDGFTVHPRLSPGMGFELKTGPRWGLYGELNHVFQFDVLPLNYTLGFRYDIGESAW